jgi:hypothetical protein
VGSARRAEDGEVSEMRSGTTYEDARADRADEWHRRALIAVMLIPVFFFLAFGAGQGLYSLLGYKPENNDAPLWVDLVVTIPTIAVFLIPCSAAVVYGRRASRVGKRSAWGAVLVGVLCGAGVTVLSLVTLVADAIRG